ncbi:MAG: dCTP deaminase [Muribaculaceae bacterium]|nr:dCTP deaminase [Muribaculaceae bacterium]
MNLLDTIRSHARGGILTGPEIRKQVERGRITISPFDAENLNPNSYNIRSGNTVIMYAVRKWIDLRDSSTWDTTAVTYDIPEDGFMLRPGNLYLIPTQEVIGSNYFEPIITGRSSAGRLGIAIHQEAGFADIGYLGRLTMQVKVTYPTKIYPNIPCAQVYFLTAYGKIQRYEGRYQYSKDVQPSKGL